MSIQGYKAFHANLVNRYGIKFYEGMTYFIEGVLRFGNDGNGFHFCKRLEDTLRYFPGMEEKIDIARVTAIGDTLESEDDYNGYYDMYCTNEIRIDKVLSREEIVMPYLNLPEYRVVRFLQGLKLTPEEIELFRLRYSKNDQVLDAISFYQEKKMDTYQKRYEKSRLRSY